MAYQSIHTGQAIDEGININSTQNEKISNLENNIKKASYQNLLDNSDFRNPVNQRGQTSYSTKGYCIDRWVNMRNDVVTLTDGGISFLSNLDSGGIYQYIKGKRIAGKTVTAAVKIKNCTYTGMAFGIRTPTWGVYASKDVPIGDSLLVVTATIPSDVTGNIPINSWIWNNKVQHSFIIEWAALYEGEYTAETLPEYQPKGYQAELAECQRYYRRISRDGYHVYSFGGLCVSDTIASFVITLDKPMRVTPTVGINGTFAVNSNSFVGATINVSYAQPDFVQIEASAGNFIVGYAASLQSAGSKSYIELSADL